MAEKEQELTPEEKLLKVIQEGDEGADAGEAPVEAVEPAADEAVVPSAAAAPEPPVAEVPAEVEASAEAPPKKSKLKLAKGAKAAAATAATETDEPAPEDAPRESSPGMIGAGPVVMGKASRAPLFGMALLNKILAVVVLVMIGFAVYEIWANIRYPVYEAAPLNDPGVATLDQVPDGELAPLDDVLKDWEEQQLFGQKTHPLAATNTVTPVKQTTPFEVYARQNLKLIGLSSDGKGGSEAILSDRKADKMHFLTLGGTFTVNDVQITVSDITAEYVEVVDGEKKVQIE
jgi:hypothetical protein